RRGSRAHLPRRAPRARPRGRAVPPGRRRRRKRRARARPGRARALDAEPPARRRSLDGALARLRPPRTAPGPAAREAPRPGARGAARAGPARGRRERDRDLGDLAAAARGAEFGRLHGVRVTAGEIRRVRRRLLAVGSARRAALPAMDAKRADLMPAAAVLVDFVLARAGAPELVACTWALREGLLLEVARAGAARRGREGGARRRSVEALAARFAGENAHGRHVARLALQVFDATAP